MLELPLYYKGLISYGPVRWEYVLLTEFTASCFEGFWWRKYKEEKRQGKCIIEPDIGLQLKNILKNEESFQTYCLNKWRGYDSIEVLTKEEMIINLL